jgi:hypothetical protein
MLNLRVAMNCHNHILKMQAIVGLEKTLFDFFGGIPEAILERKVIQSDKFRSSVLEKWAKYIVKEKKVFSPQELINLSPVKINEPEIEWLLKKIASQKTYDERQSFPSPLALAGPQYPFTHQELDHLQRKFGSLNGREMTRKIKIEKNMAKFYKEKITRNYFKDRIEDDNDRVVEDFLMPKSTTF